MQGRINCSSTTAVAEAAAFFQSVLEHQQTATEASGHERLPEDPTGNDVLRWDVSGLCDAESGQPVDCVGTFLPQLSPDGVVLIALCSREQLAVHTVHCTLCAVGKATNVHRKGNKPVAGAEAKQSCADVKAIGQERITVYRVAECSCCSEIEGLQPGDVMLVNLMLMLPCAQRVGFAAKLPEQPLACTMELQIGTPDAFKRMKKGVEAHERALLAARFPLLGKLIAIANGAEGKLTMPPAKGKAPTVPKPGAPRAGDAEQGKRMLALFAGIDLMHPAPLARESVTFEGTPPVADACSIHARDRAAESRWTTLWESPGPVFRLDSVTLRAAGKPPPLAAFALVLSGITASSEVVRLMEEALAKLPVHRGELQLVSDGLTPAGLLLGNLSTYSKVTLEYFEPVRSSQWVELSDIHIRAVVEAAAPQDDEEASSAAHSNELEAANTAGPLEMESATAVEAAA